MDKFHLCQGFSAWLAGTTLDIVDLINWNKVNMRMGYRSRRVGEYLVVLQKLPKRAKGVWKIHNIPDIWEEKIVHKEKHTHQKPINLQSKLIVAINNEGDIIVDPSAGSFSVMPAAINERQNFLGCDING